MEMERRNPNKRHKKNMTAIRLFRRRFLILVYSFILLLYGSCVYIFWMHVSVCACLRLMHGVPNEVCLFNSWSFTMPSECVCASFFSRLLLCVKGLNVVKYTKSCFCLFIYINISSFFFWFLFKLHARCICLPFFSKDFGSLCMQQLQWSLAKKEK